MPSTKNARPYLNLRGRYRAVFSILFTDTCNLCSMLFIIFHAPLPNKYFDLWLCGELSIGLLPQSLIHVSLCTNISIQSWGSKIVKSILSVLFYFFSITLILFPLVFGLHFLDSNPLCLSLFNQIQLSNVAAIWNSQYLERKLNLILFYPY